ncbi:MAG: FixH family protein [Saprospiraceae bacterium]|uniref:FixH family protein n=1 Tax=Candidatus Opimibacter skivensis TaxID=2982028 RepID=A0A9D7XSJ1_9BACT|nr:FixH family protein [Candidatus Opimibacter skivensis]
MNWGHSLTIFIIVFLAGMLGMVYYASRQSNEMIDDHYYEKEMKYQSTIDAQKNLMAKSSVSMIGQNQDDVIITFPAGSFESIENGTIELLRNDAQRNDVDLAIQTNGTDRQHISKNILTKGMYTARIKWTNDHQEYYREEKLIVE